MIKINRWQKREADAARIFIMCHISMRKARDESRMFQERSDEALFFFFGRSGEHGAPRTSPPTKANAEAGGYVRFLRNYAGYLPNYAEIRGSGKQVCRFTYQLKRIHGRKEKE
jgi:hypothetical protein